MYASIIVPLSILIPIFFAVYNYKKAETAPRLLLFYLIISGLINLCALLLVQFRMRNLPLLHVYTLVEAVFLFAYFRSIFIENRIKKILSLLMLIFPVICIINFSFFQSIYSFNTYTRPLEAILVTFFCLLYFYKARHAEHWLDKPVNWFNMGVLIYFPVAFIIFVISNYLIYVSMNKAMNSIVWDLHATLVLFMYLIWAKGFHLIRHDR